MWGSGGGEGPSNPEAIEGQRQQAFGPKTRIFKDGKQ